MLKTFSFLFLCLFLASCGKGGGGGGANSGDKFKEISDSDTSTATVAPVQAQTFDINAQLTGFERDHEAKVEESFDLIKKVVASDEFKDAVLSKTYKGRRRYVDNGGLTNAQIYKRILEGKETLSSKKNNTMDLSLKSYYKNAIVIGYTMPSIKTIYMNRKYLEKFSPNEIAMNVFHEWLHKLGFKHSPKMNPSRPHSVPYALGYIVRKLAKKYM